ncbi:hypothetical protein L7F22_028166 [Adiantum nelumboides]|nr:hypothetical protein [Adiantum nelumboides]
MDDNNKENRMSIDDFDFAHEDAIDDTSMMVNYLVTRLHQTMVGNPALQGEVQQQLHAYGILPPFQQERGPERFQGETSKRGLSTEKGVENPYQELKQLLEGKPSSKKKGHAQHERSPSREREESESQDESMEDVAPRRRRAQRSPTPTKRKRSPHSPHRHDSKRKEKSSRKRKERKRSPSSASSSPSSSSDEGSGYSSQEKQRRGHQRSYATWKRYSKLKKFKEGGKNISFLTYDEGDLENKMGEPSSSWQNFNFRDDEGSAQGMQALRLLLAKLQEAQANPRLKPSVNNLLMTEDLMLTSTQRLPSSVAPMHLEGGEGVPVMHGPMQANVVPHLLQGPLQTDGAKKKQYHGQERHVGKIREEGDFHDDDDEPPSQSRHKKRTNERRTKRSRRNSSGGSSSSSQSGRSSHGRFPKKGFLVNFWLETAELVSFIVQDRLLFCNWLVLQLVSPVTGLVSSSRLLVTGLVSSSGLGSGPALVSSGSGLWLVSGQDWLLVSAVAVTGSGPSAGTQGSATQDPHIAVSNSSSDFDVMEGYPMQQHPESSSQDMHALGQQPGISMFSRLKETLSRATRSEHATNEINEGGGEVDLPFTSQIDPVLSESAHVSTPTTTPIGLSKLTPSETLLPDGRSLAEVQEVERYILAAREKEIESLRKAEQRRATLAKAPMTSANPLQSPELTTLKSQPIGSHIASGSKDTSNTSILDGVFLNEN